MVDEPERVRKGTKDYLDPLIAKKIRGGKVIRWRLFVLCQKLIDPDFKFITDAIEAAVRRNPEFELETKKAKLEETKA